jgi:uncharacterized membrane protein
MYEALLAGHILCAVMWVGGAVTLHILGRRALKRGPGAAVAFAEDLAWFSGPFFGTLAMVLLVLGILLVGEAGYEHSQLWIVFAYVVWVISGIFGTLIYPAMIKRALAVGPGTEEGLERVRRMVNLNSIEIALLLLVVVDMATKPGL